jgi:hypothetical protein
MELVCSVSEDVFASKLIGTLFPYGEDRLPLSVLMCLSKVMQCQFVFVVL